MKTPEVTQQPVQAPHPYQNEYFATTKAQNVDNPFSKEGKSEYQKLTESLENESVDDIWNRVMNSGGPDAPHFA